MTSAKDGCLLWPSFSAPLYRNLGEEVLCKSCKCLILKESSMISMETALENEPVASAPSVITLKHLHFPRLAGS